jgi:hypothetical protein
LKVYTLVDDLDRKTKAAETVRFGLDGTEYEIDLSARNLQRFRKLLDEYVAAARSHKRNGQRRTARRTRTASSRMRSRKIRAWAKRRGYEVSERGRIPASVVAEYEARRH